MQHLQDVQLNRLANAVMSARAARRGQVSQVRTWALTMPSKHLAQDAVLAGEHAPAAGVALGLLEAHLPRCSELSGIATVTACASRHHAVARGRTRFATVMLPLRVPYICSHSRTGRVVTRPCAAEADARLLGALKWPGWFGHIIIRTGHSTGFPKSSSGGGRMIFAISTAASTGSPAT